MAILKTSQHSVRLLIRHLPHDITAEALMDVVRDRCGATVVDGIVDVSVLRGYPPHDRCPLVPATAVVAVQSVQHGSDTATSEQVIQAVMGIFDGHAVFSEGDDDAAAAKVSSVERSPVYLSSTNVKRGSAAWGCRPGTIEDDEDYKRFCAGLDHIDASPPQARDTAEVETEPAPVSLLVRQLLNRWDERRKKKEKTKDAKKTERKVLLKRREGAAKGGTAPAEERTTKVKQRTVHKTRRHKAEKDGEGVGSVGAKGKAGAEVKAKKSHHKSRRELKVERWQKNRVEGLKAHDEAEHRAETTTENAPRRPKGPSQADGEVCGEAGNRSAAEKQKRRYQQQQRRQRARERRSQKEDQKEEQEQKRHEDEGDPREEQKQLWKQRQKQKQKVRREKKRSGVEVRQAVAVTTATDTAADGGNNTSARGRIHVDPCDEGKPLPASDHATTRADGGQQQGEGRHRERMDHKKRGFSGRNQPRPVRILARPHDAVPVATNAPDGTQ